VLRVLVMVRGCASRRFRVRSVWRVAAGLCALGAASLACGATRPAERVHAKTPPAAVEPAPGWRVVRYPSPSSTVSFVERADGDIQRVVIGSFRAELRADRVTVADEATIPTLLTSCRSDGGFLHFAQEAAFWSKTFLGPLEPVGITPYDLHSRVVQCGPVVVALARDGWPNLVVSRDGIRRLGRSDLALVHFSTAEHGRAIAPPDRLLESHDGGRTFLEVAARPGRELDAPEAWLGERLVPLRVDQPAWDERSFKEAERVRAAWVRHAVASEAGRMVGGLRLTDGSWVRSLATQSNVRLAFRAPNGRVTDYAIEGTVRLLPWGSALLAIRERSDPWQSLHADGPKTLPSPPRPVVAVAADPKGRWIAARSAMWDAQGKPRPPALMTFDGQRWREHVGLQVTPLAVGSGRIVVQREQGPAALLRVVDPEHGAVELTGEKLEEHGVSLLDRFIVRVERGAPLDDPTSPRSLTWRDLDTGAVDHSTRVAHGLYRFRFADEARGIAIEQDGGLSVTSDAGRTFTHVPFQGSKPDPRHEIRCWTRGCSFADTAAFTDEPLRERPPTPGPTSELVEPPAGTRKPGDDLYPRLPVAPDSPDTDAPSYRCRATPPIPREHTLANLVLGRSADFVGPAVARFIERRNGAIVFRGHDNTGDFRVQLPLTGSGPALFAQELTGLSSAVPVLVTRSFAIVIHRQGDANDEKIADARLCIVHLNGHSECVLAAADLRAEAWPLPTGGAAVNIAAPGRQEVLVLDAGGTVQARRWFAGPAGRLALGPDGVAVLFEEEKRSRVYSLTPGSPGKDITLSAAREFGDCKRPTPPGNLLVALGAPEIEIVGSELAFGHSGAWRGSAAGVGLLEIGPHGGCWRGAVLANPFPLTLRAVGGAMHGTFVGPERSHKLVCRRAN
jgi:hypothetical protein